MERAEANTRLGIGATRAWICLALALMLLLAGAGSAAAAGKRDQSHARARAEHALDRARSLFAGQGVRTGRELTPVLARLAVDLRALPAADQRQAERLLARPTDGSADPEQNGYSVPEAPQSPRCGAHFCVHWVQTSADAPSLADGNGNGVPDYVENVLGALETSYAAENGSLGWRAAVPDGSLGTNGLIDAYLADVGGDGIYGYAAPDPGQATRSESGYLVLDNDYNSSQFPEYSGNPQQPLDVTAAHEYNHVLQFAYDVIQDVWMAESTATFMEERVFPDINDYLQYMPGPGGWAGLTETPLTDPTSIKKYGSAVWNHWLAGRFTPDAVRSAWEQSTTTSPEDFAPAAYDVAVRGRGGGGFADELDRFSAATAEWRTAGSGFPDNTLLPDVERRGTLSLNAAPTGATLDHTTFALYDIPPTGAQRLTVVASAPAGTAAAVALVGRSGDATSGTVTSSVTPLPNGGTGHATLENAGGFSRLTAVVVNSDVSNSGFSTATNDWVFNHDAQPFTLRATDDATPPTTTITSGPRSLVRSTTANFAFTSSEAGSTFECRLDSGAWGGCASPFQVPGLSQGAHALAVRATDDAGNTDPAPPQHAWTVDSVAPSVTITAAKRQHVVRQRGLRLAIRASELSRTIVRVSAKLPRRGGTLRFRTRTWVLKPGVRRNVVLRVTSSQVRMLRKRLVHGRRSLATVTTRTTDLAGNTRVRRARVRLVR